MASADRSWQAQDNLQINAQIDWIGWEDALDQLPVRLTNGSNAALNALVGSSNLNDDVPLNWRDRFVYRAGLEYAISDRTQLRAGYSYGESPVPDATLTPLTAAITEHTLSLDVGHRSGDFQIDFGYQWEIPATQNVSQSQLFSGEFSNSSTEVGIHWLILSVSLTDPFSRF